jgi:NarL family two-component system response regulator YdfI
MTARIRIVIADDHLLMRRGLRLTLEEVGSDFQLVGEASDGQSLLELVEQSQPDVVLMDLRMPKVDGLQALERIKASWPGIAVVMLTAHDDDELIVRAIRSGASGYLFKDCDLQVLLNTLRAAARGDVLLQSELAARLSQAWSVPPTPAPVSPRATSSTPPVLTTRERDILSAVARGERSKEIAAHLGLTTRTVETYLANIYNKLGVDSRAAAVAVALSRGLL